MAKHGRNAYLDATWPWGLVGKVFTSGGWVGSGALIGPSLIATAGHVVPSGWGDVERGNVIAGGAGFTNLMAWGRANWPL
jgi:V8-like Glu-specific endopeptidase